MAVILAMFKSTGLEVLMSRAPGGVRLLRSSLGSKWGEGNLPEGLWDRGVGCIACPEISPEIFEHLYVWFH